MDTRTEVERFYTGRKWRSCRKAYATSKGWLCERCLSRGLINPGTKDQPLEVHHKVELTSDNVTDPKVALNWDNLMLLCSECHHEIHDTRAERRWKISTEGTVII